jgi:two-component system CheB/CheR fusion protein
MPEKKKEHKEKRLKKNASKKKSDTIKETEKPARFPIVGIGASAGGLEAFTEFFKYMPADSGIAFVLVPHLDPNHVSLLPELLQKHTEMKVVQIEDGMKVQPNTVSVVPPNAHIGIMNGTLQLIESPDYLRFKLPIDFFFHSLAQDQKQNAVCIILSGTGTDGTMGLKSIKNEIGMVMVQDIKSAKYSGMPQSAIATNFADYVLPPSKMPDALVKYAKHLVVSKGVSCKIFVKEKPYDALQKIFLLLRTRTGHDFSSYKHNTIIRRIERRMNLHQIENIIDYIRFLQEHPHEIETLFKELLIGVTNFFRDPESFELLKGSVLPQLLKDKPEDYCFRVWVPGCATGEEAYSIAMILHECVDAIKRRCRIQVFGTDIDESAIEYARVGLYPANIASDVSPERLKSFFQKEEASYRIKKEIRETLVFAPQNLIKDPPFTKLDLLSCRNLLIYLNGELQKKLLPVFHYSLKPGGILFLGSSETIGGFTDLFSTVDKKWRIFKCQNIDYANNPIIEFPITPRSDNDAAVPVLKESIKQKELHLSQFVDNLLLEHYAPPCAIIEANGEILYIHGRTGKYLEPAIGKFSDNIVEMARAGLKMELASAIRKASSQKTDIIFKNLRVEGNGSSQYVDLIVKPITEWEKQQGLMMVIFENQPPPTEHETVESESLSDKKDKRFEELEQELRYTKENLQTTIEELETSNEELKSTNEELQSTNEELQSTNEELETSKEELQSLNEELITVNAELQGRIDDLSATNDDMKNFLDSTNIATIFLDSNFCLRRFTPKATEVINLIQTDVGRPINHIVSNLKYENLVRDAEKVLHTIVFKEVEVESKDNRHYFMRIMPYRTVNNVIDGIVITFEDMTTVRKLINELEYSRMFAESIVETVREALVILNHEQLIISANKAFYSMFNITKEETENRILYKLGNKQWDIPQLREMLEKILPEKSELTDFKVEGEFQNLGKKTMLLNARSICSEGKQQQMVLLAIEDITENKKA